MSDAHLNGAGTWEALCLHWRGRVLNGRYAHACDDWDGLPIDESTAEWPCVCKSDIDQMIAKGRWFKDDTTAISKT